MIRKIWSKIKPFNIDNDNPRATRVAFEEIITANYDRNIAAPTRGILPVIAPRWPEDSHE